MNVQKDNIHNGGNMDDKITIGFNYTDEYGSVYSSSSTVPIFYSLGENAVDVIGQQLNNFLRQVGYVRPNNHILMEDLSDEEYENIADFLSQLRDNSKEESDDSTYHENEG